MPDATVTFDPNVVIEYIISPLVTAGVIGIFAYFRKRLRCIDRLAEKTAKIDERSQRQSHALILLAQRDDEITRRLHPGEEPDLTSQVTSALQDPKGNL